MERNDIRNVFTLGFMIAVALWSANKGYEVGYKKGKEAKTDRLYRPYSDYVKKGEKNEQ